MAEAAQKRSKKARENSWTRCSLAGCPQPVRGLERRSLLRFSPESGVFVVIVIRFSFMSSKMASGAPWSGTHPPVFRTTATVQSSRCGELHVGQKGVTIATPACWVFSQSGAVPHLGPDLLRSVPDAAAVHVPLRTLLVRLCYSAVLVEHDEIRIVDFIAGGVR